jgi:hypothetical protein
MQISIVPSFNAIKLFYICPAGGRKGDFAIVFMYFFLCLAALILILFSRVWIC